MTAEAPPPKNLIQIEINGQTIEAVPGAMVIEAADNAGIRIPRFCYHRKLSVAANCRMCLVEVEKAPKPLPACATPVTAGMKVLTHSPKAIAAQQAVMEFLLINHPLDCPICDQGGECELQDVSMGYGGDHSRYAEPKRVVPEPELGPLIATEMTRCIHCTRCVRFGTEIAGVREMGAVGRGERMRITNYVSDVVLSELSGNIIDVCPVGALTSKPYRFQARAWELLQRSGIAPHDALGSHLDAHTRRGELMRVVPREADHLNETWLSDRDRFSYQGLYSSDRQTEPLVKEDGVWKTVSWEEALTKALAGFQAIVGQKGAQELGFLIHPSSSIEEMYLFQKWARALGTPHIDSRIRQLDFQDDEPSFYAKKTSDLSLPSLEKIESSDCIVIFGSGFREEQPLLNARIRKATLRGTAVFVVNPVRFNWNYDIRSEVLLNPQDWSLFLMALVLEVARLKNEALPVFFQSSHLLVRDLQAEVQRIAEVLVKAKKPLLLSGALLDVLPKSALLRCLLAELTDVLSLDESGRLHVPYGANALGAQLAGALPYVTTGGIHLAQRGMSAVDMLERRLSGYCLWHIEPEHDFLIQKSAEKALSEAEWVVLATPFVTESMRDYADVILPIAPLYETSGTLVNVRGDWQSFEALVPPKGHTSPGWRVLRVLHNLSGRTDVQFMSSLEVKQSLQDELGKIHALDSSNPVQKMRAACWPESLKKTCTALPERREWSQFYNLKPYQIDSLVRRSASLQAMPQSGLFKTLRLNPLDMKSKQLKNGDRVILHRGEEAYPFEVEVSPYVPEGVFWADPEILSYDPLTSLWIEKVGVTA